MIRTIIIEDDPLQMEILSDLIATSFPQITITGKCMLSSEGVKLIREQHPDLVLLDIDLPDKNGFEMLEELQDMKFDVIFVTAHEKYALEAFQYDTIGYVVKPVTTEKLETSLKKISEKTNEYNFGLKFQQLLHNFRNSFDLPQKIAISSLKDIHYVSIHDIIRLESEGKQTTLYQINGTPVITLRNLSEYEKRLSGQGFFRVHDKHLVNLRFVKAFRPGIAVMEGNIPVPVSGKIKEEFLKSLSGMFS